MKKSKGLVLVMALVMILSLSACGKDEAKETKKEEGTATVENKTEDKTEGKTEGKTEDKTEGKTEDKTEGDTEEIAEVSNKLEEIKAKGVIVMGTSADYPPYESHMLIDGKDEIVGFDVEIAKEIAKEIGVELKIEDMDFDGLLVSLGSNKIDMVIAGMSATEERAEAVDFSKVYYNPHQSIIIKKEDVDSLNSLEAFKDLTVGVQKGTIQEGFVDDNMPEANKNALAKIPNLIMELKSGKSKAVVLEEPVAKAYVEQNPDLTVANIEVEISEDSGSSVAVKKGEKELVELIDAVIQKLIDEGTIDQMVIDANKLMEQE